MSILTEFKEFAVKGNVVDMAVGVIIGGAFGKIVTSLVTDVIMPLMGGKVMAEWLKTTYPDLKILFTSGYTDDAIANHGVLETGVEFLGKPYTPATLARKVREMLDKGSARSLQ